MLNGQKLQGPQTSEEVYKILKKKEIIEKLVCACLFVYECVFMGVLLKSENLSSHCLYRISIFVCVCEI